MKHRHALCPGPAGFTLLELLISLTLLSFLLGLLFPVLRLAQQSWDGAERAITETADQQSARQFLKGLLTQAHAHRWRGNLSEELAFSGSEERLHFIAELPPHIGGGGLQQISLSVEQQASDGVQGRALHFHSAPLRSRQRAFDSAITGEARAAGETQVILTGAARIAFSYFGVDPGIASPASGQGGQWLPRWQGSRRLPMLVRLEVDTDEAAPWPALVVAPVSEDPDSCAWSGLYRRCL